MDIKVAEEVHDNLCNKVETVKELETAAMFCYNNISEDIGDCMELTCGNFTYKQMVTIMQDPSFYTLSEDISMQEVVDVSNELEPSNNLEGFLRELMMSVVEKIIEQNLDKRSGD